MDTTPEPAQKSARTMTDEGCQTVDFGDNSATEDVAQALADLSRQAINVGGAAYPVANGVPSYGQQNSFVPFLENHAGEPALPEIRTETFTQHFDEHAAEPEIPKSPRLQPIPSDSLSLVSPLLSTKNNIFSRQNDDAQGDRGQPTFAYAALTGNEDDRGQPRGAVEQPQVLSDEVAPHLNKDSSADLESEDIYSASPAHRREQLESGFPGIQEPIVTDGDLENAIFDSQFASENQYGHWQSAGAHLSNAASPSRDEIFMEGTHGDKFYEGEGLHEGNEDQLVNNAEMPHSTYPDLDVGLMGQVTSGWGTSSVAYPELPESGGHAAPFTHQSPHATAMSRSQSAQSGVVNLTESDDEAGPGSSLHEEDFDGSVEDGLDEEGLEKRQQEKLADGQLEGDVEDGDFEEEEFKNHQASARREYEGEYEDSEADGEADFEEEEDEREVYAKPPSAFGSDMDDEENVEELDQEEEGSYGEEEESYDEEEEEYDERPEPHIRQEPEVIDLLSSDDEDELPTRAPAPAKPPHTSSSDRHGSDSQMPDVHSEDSEGGSEHEDEDTVPYAERSEIKTSIPGQIAEYSLSVSGEEEEDEGEDEDEDEVAYEDDLAEQELPPDLASLNGKSDAEIDEELDDRVHGDEDEDVDEDDDEDSVSEQPIAVSATEIVDGGAEGIDVRPSEMDVELDDISNPDDAEQTYTPKDPDPAGLDVDVPVQANTDEGRISNASPERPSLFSRVFSLDGANDEPRFGASYRSMSREEAVLPSSTLLQKVFSEVSEQVNVQLPTPENTQISRKTVSLENSFSSVNGPQQPITSPAEEMDVDRSVELEVIQNQAEAGEAESSLATAGSSTVLDAQVSIETITTSTVEVIEKIIEMDHAQVETHTEEVTQIGESVQTGAQPEESHDSERPVEPVKENEDPDVDEQEAAESTVPSEAASKLILEDHMSTPGRDEMQSHDGAGDSRSPSHSKHGDDALEMPELPVESTRRSNRRTNPTLKAAENAKENVRPATPNKTSSVNTRESVLPVSAAKSESKTKNTKENVRPVTPVKSLAPPSTSSDNEKSPLVVIDSQATPKGHDASLEFALEGSDASSPPQHNLRKLPVADLKLRLTRALRTDFSEFTGLKVIRFHLTQKLDFLAVATTTPPEPQRAKNGPRQYQITFNITDPSIAPSGVTEVQVFRPYKDALPIVKAGDGILLRNFLVMSIQSRGGGPALALRSTQEDASSWAVFKDDGEVEVRGPPVEYGEGEKSHVAQLRTWYAGLDTVAQAKIARANGDKGTAGKAAGKKHSKAL